MSANGKKGVEVIDTPNEETFMEWAPPEVYPYEVEFEVEGVRPYLFHRYDAETAPDPSAPAKRGAKKAPDPETMVILNEAKELCTTSEGFRLSIVAASKFEKDPRGGRASAQKVYEAALSPATELCSFGVTGWDYLDSRRARIQSQFITRVRPALQPGWRAICRMQCAMPDLIPTQRLNYTLTQAGRFEGVGDGRRLGFGRFQVVRFEVLS